MPSISVSTEVHERLRIRAHRSGRSMASVANILLTRALDDEMLATDHNGSADALTYVDAVTRQYGPEAGLQALLLAAGAGLGMERSPL